MQLGSGDAGSSSWLLRATYEDIPGGLLLEAFLGVVAVLGLGYGGIELAAVVARIESEVDDDLA